MKLLAICMLLAVSALTDVETDLRAAEQRIFDDGRWRLRHAWSVDLPEAEGR